MDSKGELGSNVCPTCSEEVEILNDDLCFSLNVHMWTHKPLETINQEIDEQRKKKQLKSKNTVNNNFNPEYQNNQRVFNNSLNSTKKSHMSDYIETEKRSASSSGMSKSSKKNSNYIAPHPKFQPVSYSLLEEMFNSILSESKLHREFLSENNDGIAFCKLCNVTVQPMIKVIYHLKTKLHENNTIQFLTSLLPVELHHVMELVSFDSSGLHCSLCGFKIYSGSTNPNETILSITLHNLSKGHLENKKSGRSNDTSKKGSIILKTLAKVNPLINNNQHLVDLKMKPEFRCKLCNKVIGQNFNEKELNSLFNKHFLSETHSKSLACSVLAEFKKRRDIDGKERHNFILADFKLYCTICEMFVELKVKALISHVTHSPHGKLLHSTEVNTPTTSCIRTTNNHTTLSENVAQETKQFLSLLNALPEQLRNTGCIVENEIGEIICLICDIKFPSSHLNILNNLESHLLGRKHKRGAKNEIQVKLKYNLVQQISTSSKEEKTSMPGAFKEEFHCDICNINVPFLDRHLKEARHMNLVLAELSKTDKDIKNCIKHFTIRNGYYTCEICNFKIMNHNTHKYLKYTILNHMTGKEHKKYVKNPNALLLKKLKSSDTVVNANSKFLNVNQDNEIHCTSNIQGSCEEALLKENILSHLAENGHDNNFKKNSDVLKNKSSGSSVTILLVDSFKDDIPYVKVTSSESLLLCTLCKGTIRSSCLREHLEGKDHNQLKALKIESLSHVKTIERQNSVKNIGSLLLLLHNNNNKLPQPIRK